MDARLPESTVTLGALIKSLPVLRDKALSAKLTSNPLIDHPVAVNKLCALAASSIAEDKLGAAFAAAISPFMVMAD